MKLGFDKAIVTCFKFKQNGYFKRECTNRQADDSVNPFHEDYYKNAIYHGSNEQASRKQIEKGSSKEKKQAMLTIHDVSNGPSTIHDDNRWRIQDDERAYLSIEYKKYRKARWANRWDADRECYVDPKGNPTVEPDEVDFEVLVAAIPTVGVWCKGLEEIPRYREKVEEGVICQSRKEEEDG
ncbi:hypothetical protein Hanom_Chr06g00533411 [Helianthus anomalus]